MVRNGGKDHDEGNLGEGMPRTDVISEKDH